jgi:hypothetical protein
MPAATSEVVIDRVKGAWAVDPGVSARELARNFQQVFGIKLVGDRRIQTAVAEAKAQAPKEPFPCPPWRSWEDPDKNLDDTFFLLQLHQLSRRKEGVGLTVPEATWGTRLRPALGGLKTHQVLELVRAYVSRERVAYYLNEPIYTEDLDGFVMSQMWLDNEHAQRYEEALSAGAVPVPFLNASEAFLRELVAQGPKGLGEDTWDRLNRHPIFHHVFKKLMDPEEPLPEGWSEILLKFLDDPTGFDAILNRPAIASTAEAVSV